MTNLCLGSFLPLIVFLLVCTLGNQSLTPYCQDRQLSNIIFKDACKIPIKRKINFHICLLRPTIPLY